MTEVGLLLVRLVAFHNFSSVEAWLIMDVRTSIVEVTHA